MAPLLLALEWTAVTALALGVFDGLTGDGSGFALAGVALAGALLARTVALLHARRLEAGRWRCRLGRKHVEGAL